MGYFAVYRYGDRDALAIVTVIKAYQEFQILDWYALTYGCYRDDLFGAWVEMVEMT